MQPRIQIRPSTKTTSSGSPTHTVKKSRRNLREKSHQEFYNNRLSKLTNIFSEKGYNQDQLVTEDEILQVLDSLGKEQYNRELASQLFEKIPSQGTTRANEKRKFLLQDFVDTHIKAEYFLLLHAEEIEDELEDVYSKVSVAKDQLHEVLHQPEEPIKTDSLQIDVLDVVCGDSQYEADIGAIFSVILFVGDYKYETQEVRIDDHHFNPKFDWNFHFKLKDPNETVKVLLRDQKRHGRDETYSDLKSSFDLNNYMEKTTNEAQVVLYDHFGQPTQFKVNLLIKWPPSRVEMCENKIISFQATEEKLNEEKEYIEASIRKLVHPFACAAAAIKAKRVSMGMKSDPNILVGKPSNSEPVTGNDNAMRSIDFFKGTTGAQELSKSNPNPAMNEYGGYGRSDNMAQITELSVSSRKSGQINAPGDNYSKGGQYNAPGDNYGNKGYGNIGVGPLFEGKKKSVQSDFAESTQIINKGKMEMGRNSTEPVGSKTSIHSRAESTKQGGGYPQPGMPTGYTTKPTSNGYMPTSTGSETIIRRTKQNY